MTSLPMPQDPEFNINTATNTFYKALGDRVASGQMTLDQARAAQAEMRALQLNPAAANRQTATDIAQRHLQVGRYAPSQPQGGLTAIAPQPIREQPIQMPMRAYYDPSGPVMPQPPEREVIGYMTPPPGVRSGDTRIFADQPMAQPHVIDNRIGPNFGKPMQPEGSRGLASIGGMLSKFAEQFRNAKSMPKTYTSAPRQLTQEEILGITSMAQRPQGVGMAPQMPMKPQGLTLSNVPQQQRLTLSNVPQQGVVPQPMSAPQGMAMGGLMEKYYGGGMC